MEIFFPSNWPFDDCAWFLSRRYKYIYTYSIGHINGQYYGIVDID